ncbi:MAG TPA: hypothetical protein VMR45_04765 [Patescibacteria group bacterium]|nr:hypothetical protein [Patescibacteria group bacterium]
MNTVSCLQDFAKRAERNYKYKPNTATALAGAAKLFTTVMTEEELAAERFPLDKIDQFADRIYTKYPDKYNVDSLRVYKSRITRIVKDYETYGVDAKSMASWNPLSRQRKRATGTKQASNIKSTSELSSHTEIKTHTPAPIYSTPNQPIATEGSKVVDLHLPLSGDRTIVVYYPTNLTESEANKIGIVLRSIAALNNLEEGE